MPVAPLWSILFFTMILTLGIGSQIAIVTTVISTIVDSSPILLNRRLQCTAALCFFAFLIGLPLCSGAGSSSISGAAPCISCTSVYIHLTLFRSAFRNVHSAVIGQLRRNVVDRHHLHHGVCRHLRRLWRRQTLIGYRIHDGHPVRVVR